MKIKNVVLITIDCLREDKISLNEKEEEICPFLNSLARNGIYFKNFFANGPSTALAFPTIFSSCLPFKGYKKIKESESLLNLLNGNIIRAGFQAGNPYLSRYYNYHKGFDNFKDYFKSKEKGKWGKSKKTNIKWLNELIEFFSSVIGKNLFLKRLYYKFKNQIPFEKAKQVNEDVKDFLKNQDENYFLWVHYMDLHDPYFPKKGKPFFQSVLENQMDRCKEKKLVSYYNTVLSEMSEKIKNLFEYMKEKRKLKNTIFIITSDHGEKLGEHGEIGHGGFWEEVVHIPLIIYSKDIKSDVRTDLRDQLDIAPTILSLFDIERPDWFRGKSLFKKKDKEYVIGQSAPFNNRTLKFNTSNMSCYLRTEKWKYIFKFDRKDRLYNLEKDPKEKNNLIDKEETWAERFERILEKETGEDREKEISGVEV